VTPELDPGAYDFGTWTFADLARRWIPLAWRVARRSAIVVVVRMVTQDSLGTSRACAIQVIEYFAARDNTKKKET
jgi:hypothetical protein